ncbi:uncharacterized protein H6S33_003964 [Morchella sextelata]|uniref:uncharacterized protein n=1 Tax=Morchella sextelata TaxID=1174677 RepID=UPI001D042C28|nr:uncharacterized protein H6S33_003964 [Morchella sextelata]KAH0606303.1 hypothetical protein H6S33_003964 [Morchella sextelata]
MATATTLRVGFVPEHFSTPLHFAQTHSFFTRHNLAITLIPFPSGTGHMIKSLASHELDLAIGLTEGWIAALGNGAPDFRLIGNYVKSPLCWAISAGAQQTKVNAVEDLKGGRLGVSRVGSGSYVMGFVLAEERGWLEGGREPFEFVALDTFKGLRDGVNGGKAEAFMWEVFTTKKYYDNNEIRQIGEIYTPWPSWHIVSHSDLLHTNPAAVSEFLQAVNEGIEYFNVHYDEAVEYISTQLDYSAEDARAWLGTVEFADDVRVVEQKIVEKTVDILTKAGVVKGSVRPAEMVVRV